MKKFLLAGAFALACLPMMGEEFLLNGDFSEFGVDGEQQVPVDWQKAGNVWSGRVNVFAIDDAAMDKDPNNVLDGVDNYAQVSLYSWNSWENETLTQIVELGMATKYTLTYDWRAYVTSVRASSGGVNPVRLWVAVYPASDMGEIASDAEPIYINEINWADGDDWIDGEWAAASATFDVDPSISTLGVQIGAFGQSGDDSQGGNGENKVGIQVAKMSLVDGAEGGVNGIEANANVVATKYYTVDGVEVAAPAKGTLVIEKAIYDNGASKVAKRIVR